MVITTNVIKSVTVSTDTVTVAAVVVAVEEDEAEASGASSRTAASMGEAALTEDVVATVFSSTPATRKIKFKSS